MSYDSFVFFFFFQAEDGIRDLIVTGVQTCALPISKGSRTLYSLPLNKLHLCPVPFPTWFHQFDNIPHLLLSHLLRLLLHKHGLNWLKRLKMMKKTLQNSKWISMTIIPTNPFK